MENKWAERIEGIYGRLGSKYLSDIESMSPKEIEGFMDLLPRGAYIIDIGCAGGRDSKKFVERGFKVVGVDITDKFVHEAKKNVPSAEFRKMDVLELNLPPESFDAAWANAVLLHVEHQDIPLALSEINKVLKPGGKLHIRVKEGEGAKEVVETLTGGEQRPFSFFQKEEMEQLVQDAGFDGISSEILPDDLGREGVKWVRIWATKR